MALYLFDLDGTLISSYMSRPDKNFHAWELLPGRAETLAALRREGHTIALVSNQAGVAFGKVSVEDARRKFGDVASSLGFAQIRLNEGGRPAIKRLSWGRSILPIFVCYADARSRDPRWQRGAERRKPSGAMIREAMAAHPAAAADGVLYVGDRPEDAQAAADAGVSFAWAEAFFGGRR